MSPFKLPWVSRPAGGHRRWGRTAAGPQPLPDPSLRVRVPGRAPGTDPPRETVAQSAHPSFIPLPLGRRGCHSCLSTLCVPSLPPSSLPSAHGAPAERGQGRSEGLQSRAEAGVRAVKRDDPVTCTRLALLDDRTSCACQDGHYLARWLGAAARTRPCPGFQVPMSQWPGSSSEDGMTRESPMHP